MASSSNSCLPEDVIIEILSRLPVQSLLRFKVVCKHWLSLITTSDFVITRCTKWDLCLPAQFLGTHLKARHIASMVNVLWRGSRNRRRIIVSELERGSGKFVFCFPDEETFNSALQNGPWNIYNVPVILREWQPGFEFVNVDDFGSTMPIWVKFVGIDTGLLTKQGFHFIASALGRPIYVYISYGYAEVLVEVDFSEELSDSILLNTGDDDDDIIDVGVEYTWKPLYCKFCRCFGHEESTCWKKFSSASSEKRADAKWVPEAKGFRAGCSGSKGSHQKNYSREDKSKQDWESYF